MRSALWDAIDPATTYAPAPDGGYTSTDFDASAGTKPAKASFLSLNNPHLGFLGLAGGTAALLFWIYEGKPSGGKVAANVGPLEGEVGAGIGKE
jgi:hypothetical protein